MAGVTDHRFFDRMWYLAVEPSGQLALIGGFAFYKNMNQADGFIAIQRDNMQHNLRVARRLGDDLSMKNGPLSIEVVEPFKRLRLKLDENAHGMACDLEWSSRFPPYAEAFHRMMSGQRVSTESSRYNQAGEWRGTVHVEGQRFDVDGWRGVRDHSWGVRPGVGGFEPAASAPEPMLFLWACAATDEFVCHFQLHENSEGKRQFLDGQLDYALDDGRPSARVVDVEHEVKFVPGKRELIENLEYHLTLDNGESLRIEAQPLLRAWAHSGTGYSRGYLDGLGLGGTRGEVLEHDVYDLSDVNTVLLNGEPHPSGSRENLCAATINGVRTIGHFPVIVIGDNKKYQFGDGDRQTYF